jgi:chloride channel protein, CIC family
VNQRLGDFTTDRRVLILSAMAFVIGGIGALVAYALLWLIDAFTNLAFYGRLSSAHVNPGAGFSRGPWMVLVPVAGGLVIGAMARFGSEKIRGHGIPEAMEAILIGGSRIEAKVAVLKPLSSALSIGTGGPFGAEGPIIMTGGAFGSLFAQFFHLSSAERKTLLVAGASAGMAATFGTPVAAVLIAVELLLFEWKPRSFVPVAIASATAAAIRPHLFDAGAVFPMQATGIVPLGGLAGALGLGVFVGLGACVLTMMVYASEDLFARLPFHWMWWPAIGGAIIGIGGLVEPRALGVGYDNIRLLLDGRLVGGALLSLLFVKAIIWSLSLGSGTSGGVLAPLLIMGGAIGAATGHILGVEGSGFWAMVGMGAMIGGTMRSPLTAIIFMLELTRNIDSLLPLLIACAAAFAVNVLLMRRSILTEKMARRGHHVVREYTVDPLELARVSSCMTTDVETLPVDMPLAEATGFFAASSAESDPRKRHAGYPVVNETGRVVGMIARSDILAAKVVADDDSRLEDIISSPPVVGHPNEPVARVAERMAEAGVGRVPIVADDVLVGILTRRDVLRARSSSLAAERRRGRILGPRIPGRAG